MYAVIKGLVSIIVPVYNAEKYLRACVNSILTQSYAALDVILIDDGSTDNSGIICDEFIRKDKRVRVIHQSNSGVSKARNVGLDLIQGEFFSFVDGDDTIDVDFIRLMVDEIQNNDVDLVRLSWYRGNARKTYFVPFDRNGKYVVGLENLRDLRWFANIWGLFRSENLGSIRFDEQLKYAEDNLFVFEYFMNSTTQRMLLSNRPSYHYSVVDNSATNIDVFERIKRSKKFLEKLQNLNCLGINLNGLMDRYIYRDYLVLFFYFVDKSIETKNGYEKQDLKKKIKYLRKNGCREYTFSEKIVSAMYRHHLHFLLTLVRKLRSLL